MKSILNSIIVGICIAALSGCAQLAAWQSNPKVQQIETIAKPLAIAAVNIAATSLGVPPGATAAAEAAFAELWGGYAQVQALQPPSQGTNPASVGALLDQALAGLSTADKAAVLAKAANLVKLPANPSASIP